MPSGDLRRDEARASAVRAAAVPGDVDGDIRAEVQEALEHVHGTRRVRVLVPGRHS